MPEEPARRALVMKGGGVKGLAYVGALRELGDEFQFNWYVGTSAGAITAILLAAGYTVDELDGILQKKNFSDFLDAPFWKLPFNLLFRQGLYPADEFTIWLDDLLAKKLDSHKRVTLGQLQKKNRVTVYASRRHRDALIFDSAKPEHENTYASFAARCSMSIPFFFVPQSDQGMRVFDGGTRNNYPVRILLESDPNVDFIGLYLGPEHYEGQDTKTSVMSDLIAIWTEPVDEKSITDHIDRTIIIDPRPISTTDFTLSHEEKGFLLEAGRVSALKFLTKARSKIELSTSTDAPARDKAEAWNEAEAQSELQQSKERLDSRREELTLRRSRRKRRRVLSAIAVIALLVIGTFTVTRIIKPCFMFDLSERELSQVTSTLNNSKSLDPVADRALNRLLAIPAHCPQRQIADGILLRLAARSGSDTGNVDASHDIAHAAFNQLLARIQPGKEGGIVLDGLAQVYPYFDENSQDTFDGFIKRKWEDDPTFRQEFVSVTKSTANETAISKFKEFLIGESNVSGEAGQSARNAVADLTHSSGISHNPN